MKSTRLDPSLWALAFRHAGEERLREQLWQLGVATPTLLPFGAQAMVKKKTWFRRADPWKWPMTAVTILGPAGDMSMTSGGYYCRDEEGRFFRSTVVVIPRQQATTARALEEELYRLQQPQGPEGQEEHMGGDEDLPRIMEEEDLQQPRMEESPPRPWGAEDIFEAFRLQPQSAHEGKRISQSAREGKRISQSAREGKRISQSAHESNQISQSEQEGMEIPQERHQNNQTLSRARIQEGFRRWLIHEMWSYKNEVNLMYWWWWILQFVEYMGKQHQGNCCRDQPLLHHLSFVTCGKGGSGHRMVNMMVVTMCGRTIMKMKNYGRNWLSGNTGASRTWCRKRLRGSTGGASSQDGTFGRGATGLSHVEAGFCEGV